MLLTDHCSAGRRAALCGSAAADIKRRVAAAPQVRLRAQADPAKPPAASPEAKRHVTESDVLSKQQLVEKVVLGKQKLSLDKALPHI